MTDKDKIKEEIERRYNCEICYPNDREANVAAAVLQELLLFIDSLPEEPSTKVLEEEATRFVKTKEFYKSEENPVILIARHFAEWQKNKMKEALQTEYEKGRFDMRDEMMKDAVEGKVQCGWGDGNKLSIKAMLPQGSDLKYADKVKIIILKTE